MKAHIQWGWQSAAMYVFLFEGGPRPTYYTVGDDGHLVPHEYDPNADEAQPTLIVQPEVLEALLRASAEKLPPSDATADALKDARAVRDRLLTLVETTHALWTSPTFQMPTQRETP